MAKDTIVTSPTSIVLDQFLEEVIGERFGRYSKYIIQDRAIPDVRDGLKPVQRRILYAMSLLKLTANAPFKKCARVCGEVMGKFHPHGDSSIYEALVRMSQDWKMGIPLIEIHGNNGSIDGDSPAAYRYTECRMSKNSEFMLADIDKKTVNFAPNFDDEELEPTVLPSKFPNILVNGSTGISAGYATNIPPHNLTEVINAVIHMIDHPHMNVDDLLEIMQGPDFPTGGIVQGIAGIREAFETGRGKVIVRSKTCFEEIGPDQYRIVATEIPYEVNKGAMVKRIDQLRIDHTVDDILEVRDESDRTGLRVAIDLKKGANKEAILTYLFKNTDLQVSYNYNMVAICNRRPMTLGVLPILKAYVEHQKEVITNRSNFELEKAKKRIHIVDGLIHMVDVLDEVINEIRQSKGKADSKERLMNKFNFSDLQAEAIVTLQLYRLSNTDVMALVEENKELHERVADLEDILSNENHLLSLIKKELREVRDTINAQRKSVIEHEVSDLKIDETNLISKEQVMCCVTQEGYLKRSSLKSYQQAQSNGLKDGDSPIYIAEVNTLDTLLVFTSRGNYFYIPVYKLPEVKWKDLGNHLSSIAPLDNAKNEHVIGVKIVSNFDVDVNVLLATKNASIKQVKLSELNVSRYSKPIRCMKLDDNDEMVSVDFTDHPMEVVVVTRISDVLRYRASEVGVYGTTASGVRSILLKPKDEVVAAFYTNQTEDILLFTSRNYVKRMKVSEFNLYRRGRSGQAAIKFIKANPHLIVSARALTPTQYKANVKASLIYSNGSFENEVFEFKYNISDWGKQIESPKEMGEPENMILPDRVGEPYVDDSYLVEIKDVQTSLFDSDIDESVDVEEVSTTSLLDELQSILDQEAQQQEASVTIERRKKDDGDAPLPFKKISLFDDDDDR